MLYGFETWRVIKSDVRKIDVFHNQCKQIHIFYSIYLCIYDPHSSFIHAALVRLVYTRYYTLMYNIKLNSSQQRILEMLLILERVGGS